MIAADILQITKEIAEAKQKYEDMCKMVNTN